MTPRAMWEKGYSKRAHSIPKDGAPVVLAPDDLKKHLERKPVPKK